MNRNTEWESFVNDIKKNLPPQIELSAQKAVTRKKRNKKRAIIITTPVATAIISIVVFIILQNVSPGFAGFMSRVPFIRNLARIVTFNNNIKREVYN